MPQYDLFRTASGELVPDPNKQNGADVRKVTYYVVEEDIPLTELELVVYERQSRFLRQIDTLKKSMESGLATSFVSSTPLKEAQPLLRVMTENDSLVRWVPGSVVSFSILKWTFVGDEARYRLVQRNLLLAAGEWEQVCNVHFRYHSEYDNVPVGSAGPVDGQGRRLVTFVALQYPLKGRDSPIVFSERSG